MAGYGELEFDLPNALLDAILTKLGEIEPAHLITENTTMIPEEQGVYALYLRPEGNLVYIGKTDSDAGLRQRLTRHAKKLIGRKNMDPTTVDYKAIRLFVFTAMDLETALIQHFGGVSKVAWNHSGFGSNDPGRQRDTTNYKKDHWDTQYPIELDESFVTFKPGEHSVAEMMVRLKEELPYLLRYQRPSPSKKSFHKDFLDTNVEVETQPLSTRDLLSLCINALPAGWHATALPSHVIVYKNDERSFPSGEEIARSS